MWEHTFTNHNSPRGELWHKVVLFFMVPAFSKLKCHYLKIPQFPKPHTFGTHHSVMFSTKKLKKIGTHTLTQCHKTFLSPFFSLLPLTLIFLCLSPLHFSLPFLFIFPLVILPIPSTNPVTKMKVQTCDADLPRHPAPQDLPCRAAATQICDHVNVL